MSSESSSDPVLRVLGLSIAEQDHSLLGTYHKLGRLKIKKNDKNNEWIIN